MSMPVATVRCSLCDFATGTSVLWGRFAYEISGRNVSLRRCLGWCADCATLRPIEDLSRESFDSEFARLTATIVALERDHRKASSGIAALLGFTRSRVQRLSRDLAYYRGERDEIQLYGALLELRRSPARCLHCSGTQVTRYDLPEAPEDGSAVVTRLPHPNCSGHLTICNDGFRLAVSFPSVRIYTAEGMYLRDEPSKSEW